MAAKKGVPNPNAGRKAGVANKVTTEIKEAFRNLIETNTPNMIGWLERVAAENPAKALELCGGLAEFVIPKQSRIDATLSALDGGPIQQHLTVKFVDGNNNPEGV